MKYNNMNKDEMFAILIKEISSIQSRHILLKTLLSTVEDVNYDMPAFLQSPEGQTALKYAVMKLITEQFITPLGKPNTVLGLHLKYSINKRTEDKDKDLITQIVRSIAPPAILDY